MAKTRIFTPGAAYEPVPLPDRRAFDDPEKLARARHFLADIGERHSTRDFAPAPVPRPVIEACIEAAGLAPSGANHQPWHFCAISDAGVKQRIRAAAETEERAFYAGKGSDEWLDALSPIGTDPDKPFLEIAPWLIVVFAERWGVDPDGRRYKNYYVPESVGIACGFLIAALHHAGLATLTHTPNPMGFLNQICGRPEAERAYLILVTGQAAADAMVPKKSLVKKSLTELATFL